MLLQLIYSSVARKVFSREELSDLLTVSRLNNHAQAITGILLHLDGNFFQVLEGEEDGINLLFEKIKKDARHQQIVLILKETIPERLFNDWSMGFAPISAQDIKEITGEKGDFQEKYSFSSLGETRARKLLSAFSEGYWRSRIIGPVTERKSVSLIKRGDLSVALFTPAKGIDRPLLDQYTYAFQPIIDISTGRIHSYEALLRGKNNEPPGKVIWEILQNGLTAIDTQGLLKAINLAAHLGLATHINLNISPSSLIANPSLLPDLLSTIKICQIKPQQVILEVLESELIENREKFSDAINRYRSSGILFAIDDFGAGFAGLDLLAEFQPQIVKLDMNLIRNVDQNGPKQAIIRGIHRTCTELGLDIIAEGVEIESEFLWLKNENIFLFQGYYFAKPALEQISIPINLPD